MLLTKDIIKFKNFIIRIPEDTKRLNDLSDNRWGYKFIRKE